MLDDGLHRRAGSCCLAVSLKGSNQVCLCIHLRDHFLCGFVRFPSRRIQLCSLGLALVGLQGCVAAGYCGAWNFCAGCPLPCLSQAAVSSIVLCLAGLHDPHLPRIRTILLGSPQRSVAACMPHGSAHFGWARQQLCRCKYECQWAPANMEHSPVLGAIGLQVVARCSCMGGLQSITTRNSQHDPAPMITVEL
jgi:hypothetical protein